MRSENEMCSLILEVAKNDNRVKAVYMNGSRTNENVPKDIFQDYDIVYVVEETRSFIENKDWIRIFGQILYMQYPDENPSEPSDVSSLSGQRGAGFSFLSRVPVLKEDSMRRGFICVNQGLVHRSPVEQRRQDWAHGIAQFA